MSSFDMKFDITPWEQQLDEMAKATDEAVRPAAQVGADLLYKAVQANASKIRKVTGNLSRSIYQAYSPDNSPAGKATYHVSWRAGGHRDENGKLLSAAGLAIAPHGHLVEYGHLQRYATYIDKQGRFRPVVRPEMRDKPPPKGGKRSQAARDAYYVLLPVPKQVAAQPFIRPAMAQFAQALEAAKAEMFKRIGV